MSRASHPETRRVYQALGKERVRSETPQEPSKPNRPQRARGTEDYERRRDAFHAGLIDDDRVTCGSCHRARIFRGGGHGCEIDEKPVDLVRPHRCNRWLKK